MPIPFRRFLAALSLAAPGVALADSPAPVVPLDSPVTAAKTQAAPMPSVTSQLAAAPAKPVPSAVAGNTPCDAPVPVLPAECDPGYKLFADRFWVGAEFFLGVRQGSDVPPLLTTAPAGGAPAVAGALGNPGTQVVFGNQRYLNRFAPGLRLSAGLFLCDDHTWSVDGNFSALRDANETLGIASTPATGVFVPVVLPALGGIGFPAVAPLTAASARVDTRSLTADTNLRYALASTVTGRLDAFVGYRYAQLNDSVELNTALDFDAAIGAPAGTFGPLATLETFKTRNNFYGVNVGASGIRRLGSRFTVAAKAEIALGRTYSTTEIAGGNSFSGGPLGGLVLPENGGIFAQGTNIGVYRSSQFAVIPAGTLTLGYDVTQRLRATFGYSYLYWSKVKRAADQIDTTGTSAFGFPTADGRPRFLDRTTDFQVQGLTFGAELKY